MQKESLAWADWLRIVACFLVILSHSCDPFVGQLDNNRAEFLSGAFIGSLVRPCVPLFVMLSGALLLPVQTDMGTFYGRRMKRILVPFVFWSMALPVLYYLYVHSGMKTVSPNLIAADHTVGMTLKKLYLFLFNFHYDTTALWYIYMLIGLYLFMPVISPWLQQASRRDLHWFLGWWGISLVLPYVKMAAPLAGYLGNYGNTGLLGVCDWNAFGTFYYFSGFLGYLVLAFYLRRYPLNWSMSRTLAVAIPLFLLGFAITFGGFVLTQHYSPGNYASLEVIWYFYGVNVFMMTVSVYLIMQQIRVSPSPKLRKISSQTFGIYLCHFVFVQLGYDLVYPATTAPAAIKIGLIAGFTFGVSLTVVRLLSAWEWTRRLVM